MQGSRRLIAVVFMILILIFALIHLGVSIGILVHVRNYGDVYRPEKGLAAFDLVISIYGLIIGGFGLFSVLTDRSILSKVVAFASIALAFFALVSLITALIINSLAINYVSSRFSNRMNAYGNDQDSRNIVDKIQTHYACCGNNIWLDWADVSLNATGNSTSTAVATAAATITGNGTTTITTTTSVGNTINSKIINNDIETADKIVVPLDEITDDSNFKSSSLQNSVRRRRQTQSNYGGILGLPTSFIVTLPQSCCTTNTSAAQNSYCISIVNGVSNSFYTNGCSKQLGKFSVDETLGIVVINSFLVIVALAAIPVLIGKNPYEASPQNGSMNQSIPQNQQQYNDGQYNPGMSYNNFNSAPIEYY